MTTAVRQSDHLERPRPRLRAAPAFVARDLGRVIDGREVVRGLSLEIAEGEIFGLLGPNGAGKTTLLSMISTRLAPSTGAGWVYGKHLVRDRDAVRRLLNVAPQEDALYPVLTAQENLMFFARLHGVARKERRERAAETLDLIGLTARKDDRVETYSGGMRKRLNLGCALVTAPRLLLLDEPTAAVDPQSRARIFDAVRALRSRGTTILYTTHYLDEVEDLCDRIAIMDEGRLVACGTLSQLLALSAASEMVELRLRTPAPTLAPLRALDGVERVDAVGDEVRLYTNRAQQALPRIYRALAAMGQAVVRTRVMPVTLDEVFLELTGRALRD